MKRTESDIESELQDGPLRQAAFTDELRQEIERRVERERRLSPLAKLSLQAIGSLCCVAALLFVGAAAPWFAPAEAQDDAALQLQSVAADGGAAEPGLAGGDTEAAEAASAGAAFRSGLLIGLRTDLAAGEGSNYRTLYIAPVEGQLGVVAEGSGVLVPYKQQFWMIEPVARITVDGAAQVLTARPVDLGGAGGAPAGVGSGAGGSGGAGVAAAGGTGEVGASAGRSEKLMFAGNQYVSIAETALPAGGGTSGGASTSAKPAGSATLTDAWVTRLPALADSATQRASRLTLGEAFTAADAAAAPAQAADASRWTLTRRAGHWQPQLLESRPTGDRRGGAALRGVNAALPEQIANYDALCCTWTAIKARQPRAIDAMSSPDGEMLAIVSVGRIDVYAVIDGAIAAKRTLSLELNKRESLVMSQWATGRYVDEWSRKTRKYLAE
ncbi:MAG: hypothetical protein K0R75_2542 [Paenibacillaceae bacterium]|jgi:hypothetical protein|nr:hypothetical protein [Paenibacillaceae bacterium]